MNRRWQPLKLTSRHKEILRRTLLGQSQVSIAKELGMTQVGVNQIVNSDKFQRNLHALQGTVEQMLVEGIVDRELNDPVRQKLDEYKIDAINEMFSLMKPAESLPIIFTFRAIALPPLLLPRPRPLTIRQVLGLSRYLGL